MGLPVERTAMDQPATPVGDTAPDARSGLGLVWTLLGVFAGGLALNLTPCVYPLIPITVSFFGGRGGRHQASGQSQNRSRLVVHGLLYIGGLALTNSLLGVFAALTGGLMGGVLQNAWVLAGIALVLFGLALSMFGLWELKLPDDLNRVAGRSFGGYGGSFFMGLTVGVVAAPCIGPFILGLLAWVATTGNPWLGFLIFFILSLGLGTPLFFLVLFSGQLQRLPKSGEWMLWVRKLLGWILVGMALYFLRPLSGEPATTLLMAGAFGAAALHLGWLDRTHSRLRIFAGIKAAILMIGLFMAVVTTGSWLLAGPGVVWENWSAERLEQARRQQQPVIADFYASWCAPCRELDKIVFHHPDVVERSRRFLMIKVDLTRGGMALHDELVAQYGIRGVPTILFLDERGEEMTALRVVDFMTPEQFLERMQRVLQATGKEIDNADDTSLSE